MGYLDQIVLTLLLATTGVSVADAEYCSYGNSILSSGRECTYGCCGNYNTECCSSSSKLWLYVGLGIGGAVVVGVAVAVIFCCRRRRAALGQVIQNNPGTPAGGMAVTTATTNQSGMKYNMAYQPGAYPPPDYSTGGQQHPHAGQGQQYLQAGPPVAQQYLHAGSPMGHPHPHAGSPMGHPHPPAGYPMGQQHPPAGYPMGHQYDPAAAANHPGKKQRDSSSKLKPKHFIKPLKKLGKFVGKFGDVVPDFGDGSAAEDFPSDIGVPGVCEAE